ncbi:MAG: hypothetical protein COB78_12305 [Hyphomicrobiales bacterium]|nr:MAG: hypothetical protein COB78_12305 [Hyphomicrobiales bacterium]
MRKTLVFFQALLWVFVAFSFAQAASDLDTKVEAEFCSMLEKKPKFAAVNQFATQNGSSVEQLFLDATCPNNSKIVEIKDLKTVFPLIWIAGDPENNMIFFEQLVVYFELAKKLDAYRNIMNRKDSAGRTTLDIVEEQIVAVIKEGTNRALLNMHGFIRADMCYRGGVYSVKTRTKICDNYPTKIYAWCAKTFDAGSLGLCLGYRGKIPEKLMMMLTGKCIKLRDDEEKQKACLKPFQYSDKG